LILGFAELNGADQELGDVDDLQVLLGLARPQVWTPALTERRQPDG
jgi:hypothetical protein